jgi:hypothetical protein
MTYLLCIALGFAGGFYAGVRNAKSAKVEKARTILDVLKGR